MNQSEQPFEFIVRNIIGYALDAFNDVKKSRNDFNEGKELAYYEVLSTIKTNMEATGIDPEQYGLEVKLY